MNGTTGDCFRTESILIGRCNQQLFPQNRNCCCRNVNAAIVKSPMARVGGDLTSSSYGNDPCGAASDSCCFNRVAVGKTCPQHSNYNSYYASSDKNADSNLLEDSLSEHDRFPQMIQNDLIDQYRHMKIDNRMANGCDSCYPLFQSEASFCDSGADAFELRSCNSSSDWIGEPGMQNCGFGRRRKSYADILQMGLDQPSVRLPRPASYNSFDALGENWINHSLSLCESPIQFEGLSSKAVQSSLLGRPLNRFSRGVIPDLGARQMSASYDLQFLSNEYNQKILVPKSNFQNGRTSTLTSLDKYGARSSALSLPDDIDGCMDAQSHENHHYLKHGMSYLLNSCQRHMTGIPTLDSDPCSTTDVRNLASREGVRLPRKSFSSTNLRSNAHSIDSGTLEGSIRETQNGSMLQLSRSLSFEGESNSNAGTRESRNKWNCSSSHSGTREPFPHGDTYLRKCFDCENHASASTYVQKIETQLCNPNVDQNEARNAYIKLLLARQDMPHELHLPGKSCGLGKIGHGHQCRDVDANCSNDAMENLESSGIRNKQSMKSSMPSKSERPVRNLSFGFNVEKRKSSSLLVDLKSSRAKSLNLSEIINHAVEFSKDQHGSRFIQQKLETASVFEKEKIFPEILRSAETLMTDVFGNYVIQKFFDHGTPAQKTQLVHRISGHVLPLSLQMYGCRVIQKGLEVVDINVQTKLARELDCSVMKCVKDQNGNHVIQKCIECLPEEEVQFIISALYNHVAALSSHPYGCRVIQRILEHCENVQTRLLVMDEIMASIITLSQDQFGNYVIQHILEHGLPHEKSAIVRKLAGHILTMSQQKFASNVVEKCLTHGSLAERQLLVNAILGSSTGNDPLKTMMEDPYGNYVVQKILETCNDASLELILSRIKVHLSALKKLTYGKHIVTRVEKLITTGERRIGISAASL